MRIIGNNLEPLEFAFRMQLLRLGSSSIGSKELNAELLSSPQLYCLSSRWDLVYWFLAASQLVAHFAGVARFARRIGPLGPPELST